jgi:hypothetical protein
LEHGHRPVGLLRGELDWIVMKALEKDRNRRYETANGLATDVQHYLADEPVLACPPSVGYRLRKFVRRNRGPVLAALLVIVALVGGVAGTTWEMVRATHAEAKAVSEARQKETALTESRQSEREAKDKLWLSHYEQARARRFSRQMGQRTESLDALVRAAAIRQDERLRDEAIAAMALPDIRIGLTWHAWPPGHHGWAIDAQYQLFARFSDQGVISVVSLPDIREIQTINATRGQPELLFLSGAGLGAGRAGRHAALRGGDWLVSLGLSAIAAACDGGSRGVRGRSARRR